jgi:hypothetical protein
MARGTTNHNKSRRVTFAVETVRTVRVNVPPLTQASAVAVNSDSKETTLEMDSHADTCVLGNGALIVQDFNRPVNVTSYDPSLGNKIYQTVTGVLGYVHPRTGQMYHLVIHQGIHIPHLTHHLLCPMQARVNDVTINELPKILMP